MPDLGNLMLLRTHAKIGDEMAHDIIFIFLDDDSKKEEVQETKSCCTRDDGNDGDDSFEIVEEVLPPSTSRPSVFAARRTEATSSLPPIISTRGVVPPPPTEQKDGDLLDSATSSSTAPPPPPAGDPAGAPAAFTGDLPAAPATWECPVCRRTKAMIDEELDAVVRLQCGHAYCKSCVDQLKQPICPICRKPFNSSKKRSLEDDAHAGGGDGGFGGGGGYGYGEGVGGEDYEHFGFL